MTQTVPGDPAYPGARVASGRASDVAHPSPAYRPSLSRRPWH